MPTSAFLKKFMPSPVTLVLLGLIVYLWFRPPAWVSDLDQPAPAVPALAALRGQVVLVNFWATWCPYCRHEMPAMEDYYRTHRERGFTIVAYSTDKTQQEVDAFMAREGYTFPAPLAPPGVAEAFGGVDRLPTSFVIDRRGRIRHKISGQLHAGRLEDLISPLLAEPR
jgi:peroxiredoxin